MRGWRIAGTPSLRKSDFRVNWAFLHCNSAAIRISGPQIGKLAWNRRTGRTMPANSDTEELSPLGGGRLRFWNVVVKLIL